MRRVRLSQVSSQTINDIKIESKVSWQTNKLSLERTNEDVAPLENYCCLSSSTTHSFSPPFPVISVNSELLFVCSNVE